MINNLEKSKDTVVEENIMFEAGFNKVVNLEDTNMDEAGSCLCNSGLFSGVGSSNEKHETNSLETGAQGLYKFWHVSVEREKGLCKVGMLMDKALSMDEINYLLLARQVVLERAYVVRVTNKDDWGVVAKIIFNDSVDSMLQIFEEKRKKVRLAIQIFSKNKKSKVSYDKNQKFEEQVSNMQEFFLSIQQNHSVAPVFIQAYLSFLLIWQ
ncbi:22351_t:CDS:2 [Cetraspora pellucida]|uniref:22351_t:CDS:1 n=1 Tax=Cetraspora pellucida TaxID=1433469 RepID=A0A9N8VRR4_9GLOM|nr:22351_t:CDS:2 [Cetraspora pellucida]